MSNNKQQQKSFANLISKEEFDKLKNIESFFIENDISIKVKRKLPYVGNETYVDSYDFNPELANQIIEEFHFFLLDNNESNKTINLLKYIIENTLNKNDKKQFIKTQIEEHCQKIYKLDVVSYLTKSKIDIDTELTSFYKLMVSNILRDEDVIVDYIIKGEKIPFLKHLLFKEWFDLVRLHKIVVFLENPEQKKSFTNIISKENYDRLKSQRQFEIDNEIRIPTTYKMDLPDDEVYENTLMLLNPLLIDEIFNYYIFDKSIEDNCEFNNHIDKISIKLNIAINNESKIRILNKEYQKYSKKLGKIDLIEDLYRVNKSLNSKSKEFIDLIKNTIAFEEYIYIDFITEGYNMNFYKHWVFVEWNKIELYTEILKYLNERIKLLQLTTNNKTTNNQQQSNNGLTTNEGKYFSRVFTSPLAERYLSKILNEYNVLNKNGTVDKGFQSYCDSFWRVGKSKSFQNLIFKTNAKKEKYLEYLNNNYSANLKNTSKGKLTDGQSHDHDIKILIELYIKEPK